MNVLPGLLPLSCVPASAHNPLQPSLTSPLESSLYNTNLISPLFKVCEWLPITPAMSSHSLARFTMPLAIWLQTNFQISPWVILCHFILHIATKTSHYFDNPFSFVFVHTISCAWSALLEFFLILVLFLLQDSAQLSLSNQQILMMGPQCTRHWARSWG